MPDLHPQHGAVYAQVLIRDLAEVGIPADVLLHGTGLRLADVMRENTTLGFDKLAALFERAALLTNDDLLGFNRGRTRRMQRAGALAYVGLSAPTARDFLKNTARYSSVFSDAVTIDVDELDRSGTLSWRFRVPASVKRRQYIEFGAVGVVAALRQFTGRPFTMTDAAFLHPRKTGAADHNAYFGCRVQFGTGYNSLVFRQSDLDLPLMSADDDLLQVLKQHCEDILLRKGTQTSGLILDIERAIADRLAAGEARKETIASDLGLSPRSLTRRLGESNTSYQQVLEGFRRAMAETYLKDSDMALSEIAFLLGFSSLSGFGTAYKRWTGHSPGQVRRPAQQ